MTVADIRDMVLQADPYASHYEQHGNLRNYTVWREYRRLPATADDRHVPGWAFQIDRFTQLEYDPVADDIEEVLESTPNVSYSYSVDFENDTGFIHHIFDCEGY